MFRKVFPTQDCTAITCTDVWLFYGLVHPSHLNTQSVWNLSERTAQTRKELLPTGHPLVPASRWVSVALSAISEPRRGNADRETFPAAEKHLRAFLTRASHRSALSFPPAAAALCPAAEGTQQTPVALTARMARPAPLCHVAQTRPRALLPHEGFRTR